jgi:PAS domain S-box-containing protein
MAIVIAAVDARVGSVFLRETRMRGIAVAHSIAATTANAFLNYDYLTLHQAAQKAVREENIAYVIVLDKEGKVAARAGRPDLIDPGLTNGPPPELDSVQHDATSFRELATVDGRTRVLDVSHAVFPTQDDVQWGTVRVGLDLASMYGAVRRLRAILLGIGALAALLAVLASRIISRRITRSIDALVRGTIAVSRGDLDHRIDTDSGDEIATLAAHFNHMTEQVKRQQDEIAVAKHELEVLNSTLEEKVTRRTREFLASEEKYRTLVDSSPDPILIIQEGRIRFVNPAFERSFGWRPDGVGDDPKATDLFHPEDRDRAEFLVQRLMAGEPMEAGEIRGLTAANEVRVFEVRGMKINYLGDPAVELLLMDATERKELQDHLIQHEKMRALGELASGVAHDFNNILGIILGRAQLLQRIVTNPDAQGGLRTIERAAYDGGETVRRIQDFARSRTERPFEAVDLDALLEEVVEITRTRWKDQAELRGIRIDVTRKPGGVPPVHGNASELREVYTNLIFNAVDAMPSGGTIEIRSRTADDEVVVEVEDTGTGMSERVASRIFDPFYTTKGAKGMGLGMSVVFGIINRHKGMITVASEPGRGTCFTIRLPAASENGSGGAVEDVPSVPRAARILVVDDEPDIVELVTDILECDGHTVRSAGDGPAGLQRLEEESFDLMFCDLGMRGMSGWDVVKEVRARDATIGIVLLTGWGGTLPEERVAAHGIDAVLNKPFEMKKLLESVGRILDVRDRRTRGAPTA